MVNPYAVYYEENSFKFVTFIKTERVFLTWEKSTAL